MKDDVLIIIQARMGSSRLPGKTMMNINGKPLISYLIDTIRYVRGDLKIVIATSENIENNVIRRFADENFVNCISGSEVNVASRFVKVIEQFPTFKYFVRFCGDSPLFDADLISLGLNYIIQNQGYDILSSKFQDSYPIGSNLEIFRSSVFLDGFKRFNTEEHIEHVTQYFYQNIEQFTCKIVPIIDLKCKDLKYKLSVDTFEDYRKVNFLIERMQFQPWKYTLREKFFFIDEYFNNLENNFLK